jgi:uncharacterized protein YuzE
MGFKDLLKNYSKSNVKFTKHAKIKISQTKILVRKMVKVNYDQKWDILYVYKEGKKAKFSVEALENFVIDIGSDGKVVGLEIQNASKTLKVTKMSLKT